MGFVKTQGNPKNPLGFQKTQKTRGNHRRQESGFRGGVAKASKSYQKLAKATKSYQKVLKRSLALLPFFLVAKRFFALAGTLSYTNAYGRIQTHKADRKEREKREKERRKKEKEAKRKKEVRTKLKEREKRQRVFLATVVANAHARAGDLGIVPNNLPGSTEPTHSGL